MNQLIDIKTLEPGKRVAIPATREQVMDLEMIYLKLTSYQNLFTSYMERTSEKADTFNMEKFLNMYTDLTVREYYLLESLIIPAAGKAAFDMVKCPKSNITIDIDENKTLFIVNTAGSSCSTCNH